MDHTIFFLSVIPPGGVYNDFSYMLQSKIYEKKELNEHCLLFEYT